MTEEEPHQETDNETELDPLASSTFLRGELWTKPRPPISPINNIRKKGFGPGEAQVAPGNFYSPKEYLALWAAQVSLGVSGCLWSVSEVSLNIFERHSRDIQRHPETLRVAQSAKYSLGE